ncbi:MAG: hypothetical protein KDA77_09095, partial [Planctomycetaceae bacterium]|nr:hypothetical protein [Planctomycetaceae bacterium]
MSLEDVNGILDRLERLETQPVSSALPVGSILLSALSLKAFQDQYGPGWVRCLGQTVPEFGRVPDLRDRFPRIAGEERNLLKTQEQATHTGNLRVRTDRVQGGRVSLNETLSAETSEESANIKLHHADHPPPSREGGDWHFFSEVNA